VHFAGAIYGTILVTALVAGLSEDEDYDAAEILVSVVATAIVFWLAHVYARALADRLGGDRRPAREITRSALAAEWPLMQSAALPCAALLLGVAGVWSRNVAVTVAISLGVASLFAFGFLFARRLHRGLGGAVVTGAVNALAGVTIVVLKILIH
jgi:positive regulator of sigma E activity